MVDYSTNSWNSTSSNGFKNSMKSFPSKLTYAPWNPNFPLQIGGVSHGINLPFPIETRSDINEESLRGCITEMRIDNKLIDFGQVAYSSGTKPQCLSNTSGCFTNSNLNSIKFNSEYLQNCPKSPDHFGEKASEIVSDGISSKSDDSVYFGENSYSRISLHFLPNPNDVSIEIEFKTRAKFGTIVKLASQKFNVFYKLELSEGHLCLTLGDNIASQAAPTQFSISPSDEFHNSSIPAVKDFYAQNIKPKAALPNPSISTSVCLMQLAVNDGRWHSVAAFKLGFSLVLRVDVGGRYQFNETVVNFVENEETLMVLNKFEIDIRDGVSVGGESSYVSQNISYVLEDLSGACMRKLRLSGRHLPLSPLENSTIWAQTTFAQGTNLGSQLPPTDICANYSCPPNLVCHEDEGFPSCGCPHPLLLTPIGCQEVNLCLLNPCFHGGKCLWQNGNLSCDCSQKFSGKYCAWEKVESRADKSHLLMWLLVVLISMFIVSSFVFILAFLIKKKRKRRKKDKIKTSDQNEGYTMRPQDATLHSCQSQSGDLSYSIDEQERTDCHNKNRDLNRSSAQCLQLSTTCSTIDLETFPLELSLASKPPDPNIRRSIAINPAKTFEEICSCHSAHAQDYCKNCVKMSLKGSIVGGR